MGDSGRSLPSAEAYGVDNECIHLACPLSCGVVLGKGVL